MCIHHLHNDAYAYIIPGNWGSGCPTSASQHDCIYDPTMYVYTYISIYITSIRYILSIYYFLITQVWGHQCCIQMHFTLWGDDYPCTRVQFVCKIPNISSNIFISWMRVGTPDPSFPAERHPWFMFQDVLGRVPTFDLLPIPSMATPSSELDW